MKKWKVCTVLFVVVLLLGACSGGEDTETQDERWQEIQEAGEIVVGTSGTLIAASYYDDDDELTGFEVETMREIVDRLGLDVKFEIIGVDNVMPGLKSGRIDLSTGTVTDKRKDEVHFSDTIKYSYITMAVREDDNSGIETLEDLEGKKAGGGGTTIYSQIAEQFGAEVVTYGNAPNEAYLRDVNDGTTDVVINDYYLTKFGVAAFPEFDIHLHPTLNFHLTESAVMMPKGEDTLREKINEAIQDMHDDGTLSELAEQFYEEDASVKPDKDIVEIDGLDI